MGIYMNLLTGAGVQGQWDAGHGWKVGGHYNHNFGGGHSGRFHLFYL